MVSVVESIIEKSFRDGGKIHRSPAIIGLAQNGFSEEFISAQRERAIAHDVVSVFREAIEHSGPSRDPEDVLRYLREHEHMSLKRSLVKQHRRKTLWILLSVVILIVELRILQVLQWIGRSTSAIDKNTTIRWDRTRLRKG